MRLRITGMILVISFMFPVTGMSDSLTVKDYMLSALKSHPALNAIRAELDYARYENLANLSPEPAHLSLEREGIPSGASFGDYEERRLSLSQEFEFPLKYLWKASINRTINKKAKIEAMIRLLDLEAEIREAYLNAWASGERSRILSENARTSGQYADKLERTAQLGEIHILDARRARVEALQVQKDAESALKQHSSALNHLARMTGLSRIAVLTSPIETELLSTMPDSDESGMKSSPKIKAAQMDVIRAGKEKKMVWFNMLPDIEVSYFQQNIQGADDPDFWGVEAGISLPVWFWLSGRSDIRRSKAALQQAEAESDLMMLELSSHRNQLIIDLSTSLDNYRFYTTQVTPLAIEAYQLALRSYQVGETSYLEVLAAHKSALEVQLEQLSSAVEVNEFQIQLERLTGTSSLSQYKLNEILNRDNTK